MFTIRIPLIASICMAFFSPLVASAQPAAEKPAESLYLQLGEVGLDPSRVYQVRGASLSRGGVQISLEDGTIAFTQDVMGRITGACFEGEGEILLSPPSEVERRSMSLFTGMAILEERFATAYFRFNDDTAAELRADLRDAEDKKEFLDRWNDTSKRLASADAMRLLLTFSHMLPTKDPTVTAASANGETRPDRFLHARVQGTKLGIFDVFFDTRSGEQVFAGQSKSGDDGGTYYDVWTSFSPTPPASGQPRLEHAVEEEGASARDDRVALRRFAITTEVLPPKQIRSRAVLQCEVREGGERTLVFELSRFLQIESVQRDGIAVEFIHNPALEGTQLSRRGNDVVAVVMPEPLKTGQKFELTFVYAGEVLAEAGDGLLYVGARGTWYPNRGLEMASFDLQFSYPQGWTLVATGKQAPFATESIASTGGQQTSRWTSDRLIPVAGFNLGKYRETTAKAGDIEVETYATQGMERDFPKAQMQIQAIPTTPLAPSQVPHLVLPDQTTPTLNEVAVTEAAARAVQYFSERFGPFPYSHLALTQLPGRESQGWPGLIFLSSYAFLDPRQREELHYSPPHRLLAESVPAHETAHQWWGDLIPWSSYRDQWYSEGLANYCALMMLQERNPEGFRKVMEMYRVGLMEKNKDGIAPMDAGPVTLGTRLLSSRFPGGYEAISYGRGTWMFHMLRTMLNDAAKQDKKTGGEGTDEPFVRALRKVRQRYEGHMISTRELLEVFADDLPSSLRYEGKKSLDWFLDGWVNGVSLPTLELKGVKFAAKGSETIVTGTILQKNAPQDLVTSVPVYAALSGKRLVLLGRVFADGDESSFRLSAPAGTHRVVLDPYDTVLTRPK